jgi:acetyltransferase-like isoleucine patch superfamily enzyme
VRGIRFTAGRNFRLFGRLSLRGPGRIVFGDNVTLRGTTSAWTYDVDAAITVGDDVFLNGPHFWCRRAITIGDWGILAEARLMDWDFHSVQINRHDAAAPVRVQAVTVDDNVWLCAQSALLPGTSIGKNSVVGFGAVCAGQYPADVVIAGNPARVVRSIVN